jgi:hypothetical protein
MVFITHSLPSPKGQIYRINKVPTVSPVFQDQSPQHSQAADSNYTDSADMVALETAEEKMTVFLAD